MSSVFTSWFYLNNISDVLPSAVPSFPFTNLKTTSFRRQCPSFPKLMFTNLKKRLFIHTTFLGCNPPFCIVHRKHGESRRADKHLGDSCDMG